MSRTGAAAASDMARLQNNFITAVNRSGQFDASMQRVKTTTEQFTTALEKNKLTTGEYFRYAGASTKTFGKLFKNEFDTINKVARERVKDLQTQYIKMGRDASGAVQAIKIRPLMLDMENLSTKTQIAAQRQQLLNQLLKQGSTNMLNWGKNTQWAGRQLMVGFTVPLTMLGQIAAKTFMDMETSVIKFKRVYGDLSTTMQQTDDMAGQVQSLAKTFTKYGVAVADTMSMAADAAAMGKQGADLLAQVQSATTLAVLGGVDQQQALETTISLTNAFGISADQLKNKINFLNAVENQSVLSIEDMTIAIPKAAPVIQQLGGNVEDLAFFLTAMKEGGINASEGANALKSGLASMINPSKKASDMLAGLGINLKNIVQSNKGDVKGMVVDLGNALNALDPLKRAQAIEQVFGKFQFARISTLLKNVTDANSQASSVANLAAQGPGAASVLAERELKRIEDSPMFKFKKALEDLKVELIPLGEQFMKAVTPIAKFFTDVLKNFNNMSSGAKDFVGGLTLVLAGVGPVALMAIGLIANGIANMIKLFASVKSFFNNLGQGTKDLGSQTSYMTQEQIEARAVAASLEQVHEKLTQTFTAEAGAVALLRKEMERAVAIQNNFGSRIPGAKTGPKPKKMATGGVVVGPGGPTDDKVPANLSNGEVVLSVENVKKNPAVVAALLSGAKVNIPGYAKNGVAGYQSTRGFTDSTSLLSKTANDQLNRGTASPAGIAAEYKANPKLIQGPLIAYIAKELFGAKTVKDIQAAVESNPEIAKYAEDLSHNIAKEVSNVTGEKMGDPEYYAASDKARAKTKSSDPRVQAAADKFATNVTTFDDNTRERQRGHGGFGSIGREAMTSERGRYTGVFDTGRKFASAEGMDTSRSVAAHNTAPVIMDTPADVRNRIAAQGQTPSSQLDSALSRKDAGIKEIYGKADVNTKYQVPFDATKAQKEAIVGQVPAAATKPQTTQAGAKIAAKIEQDVAEATNVAAQAQSPSRRTKEAGKNLADGAIVGINEAGPAFKKSVADTAKSSFVISPASAQYAKEQFHKMMRPFTDSAGIVNVEKLNAVHGVRVHLITQEEKNLRQASQMLAVADNLMKPYRVTVEAIGNAAFIAKQKMTEGMVAIKNFAVQAPGAIRNAMNTAATAVKAGVERMKVSLVQLGTKLKQAAATVGKGVIGQLGSGKAMMTTAAVMGTLSMMPGKVGEIANAIMMPLMLIQSVIALIPETMLAGLATFFGTAAGAAVLAIAAPLAIFAGIIAFSLWQQAEANKKAAQLGNAMAVASDSVKKFGELTGRVGLTEAAQAESDARRAGLKSVEDLQIGKDYVASDAGKADVANLEKLKESGKLTPAQVAQQYSATLAQAISQGTLTLTEANSIATAVGKELGDSAFPITVTSQLSELLGPDGTDILKDPLKVTTKLIQSTTENADFLLDDAVYTQKDITAQKQESFDKLYGNMTNLKGEKLKPGEQYTSGNQTYTAPKLEDQYAYGTVGGIKPGRGDDAKAGYTAMLGSYGSIQTSIDSGVAAVDKKIAEKQKEFDAETDKTKKAALKTEITGLEGSRDADITAIYKAGADQRAKINTVGKAVDDKGTFNTAVDEKYANATEEEKTVANKQKDAIKGVENSDMRMLLEGQFLGDAIGNQDMASVIKMAGEGGGGAGTVGGNFSTAYQASVNAMGDRQTTELMGSAQARGANTAVTTGALERASRSTADQEAVTAGLQNVNLDLTTDDAMTKLNTFANAYKKTTDDLKKIPETKLVATAVVDKKMQDFINKDKVFQNLKTKSQKVKYLANFNATLGMAGDKNLQAQFKAWAAGDPTKTFSMFASYLAGKSVGSGAAPAAGGDTGGDTGGGGGGGTPIDKQQRKMDYYSGAINQINKQEEKINKAYDERMKAMDKIQKANDVINQQKKDQLDLADALSKGDIGAAARAQQQARQNAQNAAMQEQRDRMTEAKDSQIASLTFGGKTKEQWQSLLDAATQNKDLKELKSAKSEGWAMGGRVAKHFASGGMMNYLANGKMPIFKPMGKDTIPAMLQQGEFVVKKSATDKLGAGNMAKINRGEMPSGGGSSVYNYSISVNVKSDANADQIAKTVMQQIQRVEGQGMKGSRV
jgi:TP901 family phage tail tape measure protein